jgi:hypothetical protein
MVLRLARFGLADKGWDRPFPRSIETLDHAVVFPQYSIPRTLTELWGRSLVELGWSMKFPYERRSTRLGPSTWRRTRDVDVADDRRCLLERHLQRRLEAGQSETEVVTCSGLAYLDRLPKDE